MIFLFKEDFMKNGYIFYESVKRLVDKHAYFQNGTEYEKFIMELAEIFKI